MTTETKNANVAKIKTIETATIKELVLTFPKKQFIASGGDEEDFIREAGFALQIINNNDYLARCNRQSIVDAIANVAMTKLTLNPELRLAYLVPYKGKVFFRSSYMGKVDILIRAGVVKDIFVRLVHENDQFYIEGDISKAMPVHKYDAFKERGQIVGGYYVAKLVNGEVKWDTMQRSRIDAIKKRSEAAKAGKGSPWDTDEEEMIRKTIINWAFKFLPKTNISKSVLQVLEADGELDREIFEDVLKKEKEEAKDDFYAEEVTEYTDVHEEKGEVKETETK